MIFEEVLIHYTINSAYINSELNQMIDVLNSNEAPNSNESCENCAYSRKRSEIGF